MRPLASVIVRCRDKESTLGATLRALRSQTVPVEIVVVDSGSVDGTLSIAERYADRVVTLRAEDFTFGRALNLGAAEARAPVHFALSAHCVPAFDDWVERSLAHYERPDVAGAGGAGRSPGGDLLRAPYAATAADPPVDPFWGMSNHGSSWRATVWQQAPFREDLAACEDKEWSWRVLGAGWTIVFDPHLYVPVQHRAAAGIRSLYRRHRMEAAALASLGALPRPGLAELARRVRHLEPTHHSNVPPVARTYNPWHVAKALGDVMGARSRPTPVEPGMAELLGGRAPGVALPRPPREPEASLRDLA